MPRDRKIPSTGLCWIGDFWKRFLDISEKVAVYWPSDPDDITLIDYYDTVSAGNTARLANVKANGALPTIAVNWIHSTMPNVPLGAVQGMDAREDLPSWFDEEPAS